MFQFCIRNLKFANDEISKISVTGRATIDLFLCKHDVKSLHTNIHHESGSNKITESNDDCVLPEETNKQDSIRNKEFLKLQITNKLFKIKGNLQSFPIVGSEITDNYGIHFEGTDENLYVPSVSHILSETKSPQSKLRLEIWKKDIINHFGEKYFNNYYQGVLSDGKLFHVCIQNTLEGHSENLEIPPSIESAYFSIKPVLNDITSVEATETHVIHPTLRYQGIVDCIAYYGDEISVIDWKKSDKPRKKLRAIYDAPLQVAAYIGAINASHRYPSPIDKGLVVVGYTNGDAATVHVLQKKTLQDAWEEWLRRLEQYYTHTNLNEEREE